MTPDDLDRESYAELRRLGELLFDVAAGREPTRSALTWQTGIVAYALGDRRFNCFTEADFDVLAGRLLEIADDWFPVDILMARALAVILGEPLPQTPSWAAGRQRANLSDGEAVQ